MKQSGLIFDIKKYAINDGEKNIKETALFVSSLHRKKKAVNLLPYHNIAANKYRRLGKVHHSADMAEPDSDKIKRVVEIFSQYDLKVKVGG